MEEASRILIVDDSPSALRVLSGILGVEFRVSVATSGAEALDLVQVSLPDLVLLDIRMPGMDGYEVLARLKSDRRTHRIPVLFVSVLGDLQDETRGLELGAADYIVKPFSPPVVRARVRNHLRLKAYSDGLEQMVADRTSELLLTQQVTIEGFASLAEYRDLETGTHIRRTREYVLILAEYLSGHPRFRGLLDSHSIRMIADSAPLHDIGKVGVPDSILLKPDKLSFEEYQEMKKHPQMGLDALRSASRRLGENSFLRYAMDVTASHHEWWDGSGYPAGLKAEAIPLAGRLMTVADIYDALISRRPYKQSFSHAQAMEVMHAESAKFDPDVFAAFLNCEGQFNAIRESLRDAPSDVPLCAMDSGVHIWPPP